MREHWGRLLALLVAQYRRLDLAEDGLGDAFEAAARTWPGDGVPDNPPAWLLTAARRRVLDRLRAEAVAARKDAAAGGRGADSAEEAQRVMADAGELVAYDERLRLVLLCAHPALGTGVRRRAVAAAGAWAWPPRTSPGCSWCSTPTMAARLTRARKRARRDERRSRPADGPSLDARRRRAADVAYLAFTAGYAPGSGPDVLRPAVAGEGIRLARVLREVLPGRGRHLDALLALMLLQHSRRDARVGADGRPVLLPDQDRGRWHADEIAEAVALLDAAGRTRPGRAAYLLQALIAAEHAIAADGRRHGLAADRRPLRASWRTSPARPWSGSTGPSPWPRPRGRRRPGPARRARGRPARPPAAGRPRRAPQPRRGHRRRAHGIRPGPGALRQQGGAGPAGDPSKSAGRSSPPSGRICG